MAAAIAGLAFGLSACRTSGSAPKAGPRFVIDSPAAGSSIGGTVVFGVQPADPGVVKSVTFKAGSRTVATVSGGKGALRTFLRAKDYPAGPLTLRAVVTGTNGGVTSRAVSVTNVPEPPSSTTVGAAGAVVGTTEANGSVSTLALPAGVGRGATLAFTAKTKAQVKAATGVDYDALGVTFLGAQQIDASQGFTAPLSVSSGGFGPQVQPGQAVVNYSILPDMNGDGVGELVVTNTASVAPDGDVVSDPVPKVVLTGQGASASALHTSGLHSLSAGLSGPPGTVLTLQGSGFNPIAGSENHAVFKASDGTVVVLPLIVLEQTQNGAPSLMTAIPAIAPGAASLTLVDTTTGHTSSPITVNVEAPPALNGTTASVINGFFAKASTFLQSFETSAAGLDAARQEALAKLADEQQRYQQLLASTDPRVQQKLKAVAQAIQASGVMGAMAQQGALLTPAAYDPACTADFAILQTYTVLRLMGTVAGVTLCAVTLVTGGEGCVAMVAFNYALGKLADKAVHAVYNAACGQPCPVPAQMTATASSLTGMGSVLPGGGSVCGMVGAPFAAPLSTSEPPPTVTKMAPRRFLVTIQTSSGSGPFTAVSDPSGYFYFPAVPQGQPFTVTAVEVATGKAVTVKGIGAAVGSSTTVYPDFFGGSGNGSGVAASFNATEDASAGYKTYDFDASGSSDALGTITTYDWNFGDGSAPVSDSGPYETHQYTAVGTYTATLTVLDAGGTAASSQQTLTVGTPPPATAKRIDLGASGTQADLAAVDTQQVGIDSTGAHVDFWSFATNLGIPNEQGALASVYLSDVQAGTLEALDPQSGSPPLLATGRGAPTSGDGSLAVFSAMDAGRTGIWLWHVQTGTVTMVDTAADGTPANADSSDPSISSDGRYVAFTSFADNLVPNDTNGLADVFVKDLQTGTVVRASDPSVGAQVAGGYIGEASLSPNGNAVAFLASKDGTNTHVYVRDLTSRALTQADTTASGAPAVAEPVSGVAVPVESLYLSLSADGRYVAFTSNATNLSATNPGVAQGVYVKDLQAGTVTRADVLADGTTDSTGTLDVSLSGDGRYVAFEADDDILPSDTNSAPDVYVKDLVSGTLAVVSAGLGGRLAGGASTGPAISSDGRVVAFVSAAPNLVPFDSNGVADVFVAPNPLAP